MNTPASDKSRGRAFFATPGARWTLLVVGVALIVAGMLLAVTGRLARRTSSGRRFPATTVPRPQAPGLVGSPSLRAAVGERRGGQTVVRVEVTAPTGATEMALSSDPTFGGAPWLPVATSGEVMVAGSGYTEIFGRFRAADGSAFVPAITGLDVTAPVTAGVRNIALVSPTVVSVSVMAGRVGGVDTTAPQFDPAQFDLASAIRLRSADDPAAVATATAVARTTRPTDMGPETSDPRFEVEHRLFITFAQPLREGARYTLALPGQSPTEFTVDTHTVRSPAVQVNQVGFMPNDPVKVAFLSASLAGRQPIDYSDRTSFDVIDSATQQTVFTGNPVKRTLPDGGEYGKGDLTGAPVWELDFSPLTTPGRYRVCVTGVGCSADVAISNDGTWLKAAATVARAALNQRSGIELQAPYTSVTRPRIEHPDDGRQVQLSALSLLDNGQGSDDTFDALVAKSTRTTNPDAWGGHMDAGDWDRRIQHLWYLRAGLDLVDMFPETFAQLDLDIPESRNNIPDLVDEGLWSLDFYLRLQDTNGGIRGGVEADAAPPDGETSWTTKQRLYAYAADPWSSYLFTGAAAEAAYALRDRAPQRSKTYLAAATRAFTWAGAQPKQPAFANDIEAQRFVASAALYRATGDKKWHDQFLKDNPLTKGALDQIECHRHELCDAAWIYLRSTDRPQDATVVANAKESFRRTADSVVAAADTSLYRFTLDDPNVPLVWGLGPSTPKTTVLIRAYLLFGDKKYWAQAARAGGYALGANPLNTSFVTGLGQDNPKHPLVVDQRNGNLPVWPGIPVYGTQKVTEGKDGEGWFPQYFLNPAGTTPGVNDTPALWSWYDLPAFAAQNEYTLHQSHGVALFAFGSLAALASR